MPVSLSLPARLALFRCIPEAALQVLQPSTETLQLHFLVCPDAAFGQGAIEEPEEILKRVVGLSELAAV